MARSSECTGSYAHKVLDRDPHCQRRLIASDDGRVLPLQVKCLAWISLYRRTCFLRDSHLIWLHPPSSPLTKRRGGLHLRPALSNGSARTVTRFLGPSCGFRRMAWYRACLTSRT